MNEQRVSFQVFNFECTPEEVSEILGIKPNQTDPNEKFWEVSLDETDNLNLEECTQTLLNRLPSPKEFEKIPGAWQSRLLVAASMLDRSHQFHLSQKSIATLAQYRAEFELDHYLLPKGR